MFESVGKYDIICEIARGGMGIVYKAEDTILKRKVAIKALSLIDVEEDRKEEFQERFRREAILAAKLNHKNIVRIFDICITAQGAYHVMEYLHGKTLAQELENRPKGKMTAEEYWPIFRQACNGLSHAGSMNIVHRDIKPDNIFILTDGTVKITDFGIAFSRDHDRTRLTNPGSFLGTLLYVSPEQLQDSTSVDQRADIYSLAALSYEVLSGELPVSKKRGGLPALMHAIITKPAVPLNLINPEISADLAAVIAKAMEKDPDRRYATALEFEKDYERAMLDPRGSKRTLLAASDERRSAFDGRSSGTMGTHDSANRLIRGSQKFNALTRSVPLVKTVGQIIVGDAVVAISARKGKLVVADSRTREFRIYGANGKVEGESRCNDSNKVGSKTKGGLFSKPSGLAIDVLGKIYATDATDQFVRVYDPNGWFVREFQNKNGSNGGISGVLLDDREGCIYLADPGKKCVHCVRSDLGTWLFDSSGSSTAPLQLPLRMAMDGLGQLYVLDQELGLVSIFARDGSFKNAWSGKNSRKGAFNKPSGMAIDQADRLYIADPINNRVLVFSSAGDYLFVFGGDGTAPGQFKNPLDLAVDLEKNLLYVLDKGNCRVQIFEILMELKQ